MSVYYLLTKATATQAAGAAPPSYVSPWGATNPTTPPSQETFVVEIIGTAGNVGGTVQLVASNDPGDPASVKNWVNLGDPLIAPSTYLTATYTTTMQASFKHYGALLTAISGTGAAATVTMAA